jgi:hypothetical protein
MQSAAIHCRNSLVSKARPGPGNGEDRSKTWDIFLTTHKTHKLIYLWSSRHGDTFAASAAPKHLRTPSTWDTPSHFAERNGSPVQFSKLSPTCLPTYRSSWILNTFHGLLTILPPTGLCGALQGSWNLDDKAGYEMPVCPSSPSRLRKTDFGNSNTERSRAEHTGKT